MNFMNNEFVIYPAIDIRGGKCVRLFQGDYNQETVYGDRPAEMGERFEREGATWLHVVDLDGAKAGQPTNLAAIEGIIQAVKMPVQVGGGLRKLEHVEQLLALGVSRVILGTAAIEDRAFVESALQRYGGKIAIGIDARDGYVATRGWLETSEVRADALAQTLAAAGAQTFIFTDIARDGTMSGPNTKAIVDLARACGRHVIASGGVSQFSDLQQLATHASDGVCGAIVGKALYTGAIDLSDALERLHAGEGV
jgi:phosphoribosylformimino-5-aminoimidazole carboxamide ribotide isomerase